MKFGMIMALFVLLGVFAASSSYAGAAAYSNIGLALSTEKVSTCPADTKAIEATISNNDVMTHTYALSLALPQGWTIPDNGFIQPDITLASGESQKILFWINPPTANPATYNVGVKAAAGNEENSKSFEVDVLRCHSIAISAPEAIDVCTGSEFQYSLSVSNDGKYDEEFDIIVAGSWSGKELHGETAMIESGKSKNVAFNVASPKESGRISVKTISKTSYASSDGSTQVNVNKCYDFDASVQPKESSVCLGTSAKYMLTIKNTGTSADVYAIHAPQWASPSQPDITILPNEEKNVELNVLPEVNGKVSFDVNVISKGGEVSRTLQASVEAIVCRSVAVIVSPAKIEVCKGLPAEFKVTIKNTGMATDTYSVTSNFGTPEYSSVTVEANAAKELSLAVDTEAITEKQGEKAITVTAKSGDVSDTGSTNLVFNNCYSAEFGVSPQNAGVCAGEEVAYTIVAKNTGEFADNYTLGIEGEPLGLMSLAPGELKTFSTTAKIGFPEGENRLTFTLSSEHVSMETVSGITVKPQKACYNLEFTDESPTKTVDAGKGIAIAVNMRNTGEKDDSYALELIGPEWMHVNGNSLSLMPGEDAYAYVYASPDFDVRKGVYNAQLKATSTVSGEHGFDFKIGVGMIPTEDIVNPSGGMSITGNIVNLSSGTGKILLLAMIVVMIIIILAVKFVLFVK